jgi:hypothetical protein
MVRLEPLARQRAVVPGRDAGARPAKLGQRMIEGAAVSKRSPRVGFSVGRDQDASIPEGATRLLVADLDTSAPTPVLRHRRVVFESPDRGCQVEAQDFFRDDQAMTYTCYEPEGRANVWTIDLRTGERVKLTRSSRSRPR